MNLNQVAACLAAMVPFIALGAPPENTAVPAAVDIRPEDHRQVQVPASVSSTVTNEQLRSDPGLAGRFLSQAVDDERWDVVRSLLPIYRAAPQRDTVLLAYAEGALARHDGEYAKAIAVYREVLAANPNLTRIRLDLARMLFENRQYEAARFQFEKARSEHLPEAVLGNVQRYLEAIDRVAGWSGSLGLSYLNDDNVNNASRGRYIDIGGRQFRRNDDAYPQRGHGVDYSASLLRDFALADHHSIRFQGQADGRSYWDNHRFDDVTARSYLGYSYSDANQRLSLLPFYEKRWYGTQPYSAGAGFRTEYSRVLSPNWQSGSAFEYQHLGYDDPRYGYLDGHALLLSSTLGYAFSSRLALYGGADVGEQVTRSDSDTNHFSAVRLGFEAELPWSLAASLSAGEMRRVYEAENDIFAVRRRDTERNYLLSLWHRNIYFWGILPKLNISYRQVDSNIDYYSYDQKRIYLSATRAF